MKYATTAMVLATAVHANQQMKSEALTDAVQVMEGIIMGTLDAEFKDIEHCIQDGEAIIQDVENAWKDFKSHDFHDIMEGLKAVGHALMEVKTAMTDCKGIVGDFEKLSEMAVIFSNPESVVWHIGKDLVIHGVDIWHEVGAAVQAIDAQPRRYYDFGFNVGKAAAQVILGEEGQLAVSHYRQRKVAEVIQGITQKYGGHFSLENLLFCVYEEDQAAILLYEAVQTFEEAYQKKDWQEAIGGVIALVGFVQQFKQGLPICEAIDTKDFNWKEFNDSIDIAAHPMEHFEILENDIKMHGVSIMKWIEGGLEAYHKGDNLLFGQYMGAILRTATDHNAALKKEPSYKKVYPKDNREMATEIFQGFMESCDVGTFNFTNLLLCVYEADQSAIALYEGVQLIEEAWQKKEWQDAMGGAIFVAAAVQTFRQQALPVCEQIDSSQLDFSKFDKVEQTIHQKDAMKVIGENIIFNGVTITADIIQAMTAFEKGEYKEFGSALGHSLLAATAQEKNMYLY